jgi:hypothetical protein
MASVHPAELYGLLAEFCDSEELLAAVHRARVLGYRKMEAYSPFNVEGLSEAMEQGRTRIPLITLIGGVCGGITAYAMMYYATAISYPVNVGGRPLDSWPAFVPITFELTVLGAALFAFFGMLISNGLPRLYHPVFRIDEFAAASRDRFFLCIEARDPNFRLAETREFLAALPGSRVFEVPP